MDYVEIMSELPQTYNEYYECILKEIFIDAIGNNTKTAKVLEELKVKRDAGLKKYGELSFQNSFVNSMNSPTLEHAKEELLDAMNYIAHEVFKSKILYPKNTTELIIILHDLYISYTSIGGISCVR
jgi:hypothetical protein